MATSGGSSDLDMSVITNEKEPDHKVIKAIVKALNVFNKK
jgi:hypothetical protein